MTQDEIIKMAKQSGLLDMDYELGDWEIHEFTTFAKLVAAKEREACAKLIEEMPCDCCWPENSISVVEDFAEAIRARGEV